MEQVQTMDSEKYHLRGAQMDTFCPPEGESFADCQQRSVAAFQKIAAAQQSDTAFVIVAHAGVNRCILSWLANQPLKKLLTIPQPYACVTELQEIDGVWRVEGQYECPV